MRITRQSATGLKLVSEIVQLLFGQSSFEKRSRIHTGAGVALKIYDVARVRVGAAVEEMIETNFIERGGGSVSGNVAAHVGGFVRPLDHRHRVPTDDILNSPFQFAIAGK